MNVYAGIFKHMRVGHAYGYRCYMPGGRESARHRVSCMQKERGWRLSLYIRH